MKMWESRAKYIEQVFGDYVDWENRFYECPECGELVDEDDWDENELCDAICPICGFGTKKRKRIKNPLPSLERMIK